jgi:hypothetical protein
LRGISPALSGRHFGYFRGSIWALAILDTTRKCMTDIVRIYVFVERHLASWERFLVEYHGEWRG